MVGPHVLLFCLFVRARGGYFATMIIATVVINQLMGPPLMRWALRKVNNAMRGDSPNAEKVVVVGVGPTHARGKAVITLWLGVLLGVLLWCCCVVCCGLSFGCLCSCFLCSCVLWLIVLVTARSCCGVLSVVVAPVFCFHCASVGFLGNDEMGCD